jgi:hypothetical protein
MQMQKIALRSCISLCAILAALFAITAGALANLPDHRSYEMVSPVEKGGQSFVPELAFVDPSGEHAIVDGGASNALLSSGVSWMLETRTASGWSGVQIGPPPAAESSYQEQRATTLAAMSEDLSRVAFQTAMPLDSSDRGSTTDVYVREGASGPFTWASGPPAPLVKEQGPALGNYVNGECNNPVFCYGDSATFAGSSTDLSHIVWSQRMPLLEPPATLPGSPADTHAYGEEVYESVDGADELVGLVPAAGEECDPSHGSCVVPPCGAAMGNVYYESNGQGEGGSEGFAPTKGAVSRDGSQVVFTSPDPNTAAVAHCPSPEIYVRRGGTSTVEVSGSQKTNGSGPGGSDPHGSRPKLYAATGEAGGQVTTVFFTSTEELTDDANTGSEDQGNDLYAYSLQSGRLTDLTPDAGDADGAEVTHVLGAAEDGALVYFTARGALAAGATAGQPNLYVRNVASGRTSFIASGSGVTGQNYWEGFYPLFSSEVTPNGEHLLFASTENLTSYDQEGNAELYLYDEPSGSLICVSCGPAGAPPQPVWLPEMKAVGGHLAFPEPGTLPPSTMVSEDGERVFFSSSAQLTPEAPTTSSEPSLYEYEEGRVYLIAAKARVIRATPSGNDVFFATADQLVPQDGDGAQDVYDARVDGGFPSLAPPSCSGTSCQGVPAPAPIFATPPSVTFNGVGNFPPAPATTVKAKQKKSKAKAKKRLGGKHVKRKAKRSKRSRRRSDKGGK